MFDLRNRSFLTRATSCRLSSASLLQLSEAEQRQVCGSSATTTELCAV